MGQSQMGQQRTKSQSFLKRWVIGEFSWKRLVRSAVVIYAGVCLYALFFADSKIFLPPPASYPPSAEIRSIVSGHTRLAALYLPNPKAQYTILYSHGNAEDLGQIRPILELIRQSGFSVYAYDYRGYGLSEGKPSERHSYRDVDAAYTDLVHHLHTPPQQIIAHGRSLGGAIAIDLAAHHPLGGLIVESTFISGFRVLLPFQFLPFEKFHSMGKLDRIHCPVLVMHGKSDRTIPFWHGETLYKTIRQTKQFLWVEGAEHDDLVGVAGDRYTQALKRFVGAIV
jgi:abhydrolase domain-containing protein 17